MAKNACEQLSPNVIENFLNGQREKKRGEQTLEAYRRNLMKLYHWLPEEKLLTEETGREWKAWMEEQGMSARSVNSHLSALNSLCDHLGRREFQIHDFLEPQETVHPELSRSEYLRLLNAAKLLGKEQTYFIIKILGGVGVRVQELPQVTAQAVQAGTVELSRHNERRRRTVVIPQPLRKELLGYVQRKGMTDGPVFRTAHGSPMPRTYVCHLLQQVSQTAQIDETKATPRCLWNMYQNTREDIFSNISLLADREYDKMLSEEQRATAWDS